MLAGCCMHRRILKSEILQGLKGVDRCGLKKGFWHRLQSIWSTICAQPHRIFRVWRRQKKKKQHITRWRADDYNRHKKTRKNNKEKHNFFSLFMFSLVFVCVFQLFLAFRCGHKCISNGHKKSNINSEQTVFMPTKLINIITQQMITCVNSRLPVGSMHSYISQEDKHHAPNRIERNCSTDVEGLANGRQWVVASSDAVHERNA